jgi:hypothetical protein
MKTLIQIFIIAMFGIEICSPFFLGYLNQKQKLKKVYSAQEIKSRKEVAITNDIQVVKNLDMIDFTGNNYSDSKTIKIKE